VQDMPGLDRIIQPLSELSKFQVELLIIYAGGVGLGAILILMILRHKEEK